MNSGDWDMKAVQADLCGHFADGKGTGDCIALQFHAETRTGASFPRATKFALSACFHRFSSSSRKELRFCSTINAAINA
jgi:hypothetical protein